MLVAPPKGIPVYEIRQNGTPEVVETLPFEEIQELGNRGEIELIDFNGQKIFVRKPRREEAIEAPKKEEVIENVSQKVEPLAVVKKKRKYSPRNVNDERFDNSYSVNYSPSLSEMFRNRLRYVFEPIFSNTVYEYTDTRTKYKPRFASKQRYKYKPTDVYKYVDDYNYEPTLVQITAEDYAPRDKGRLRYNPQVAQESYPVYNYSSYGIPDTFVDEYAPEESVRIKPVTEFEVHAKPTPLIVSQTYLNLLGRIMRGVTQ